MMNDQKKEAMLRMNLLNLPDTVKSAFEAEKKIYVSDAGALKLATQHQMEEIQAFEREYESTVYHAIRSMTSFGEMLSLLFVSDYDEEWEMDRECLSEKFPFVQVINEDNPCCSEMGDIQIDQLPNGSLIRIA